MTRTGSDNFSLLIFLLSYLTDLRFKKKKLILRLVSNNCDTNFDVCVCVRVLTYRYMYLITTVLRSACNNDAFMFTVRKAIQINVLFLTTVTLILTSVCV